MNKFDYFDTLNQAVESIQDELLSMESLINSDYPDYECLEGYISELEEYKENFEDLNSDDWITDKHAEINEAFQLFLESDDDFEYANQEDFEEQDPFTFDAMYASFSNHYFEEEIENSDEYNAINIIIGKINALIEQAQTKINILDQDV